MAGHASNWFKLSRGEKGRVFISNAAISSMGFSKAQLQYASDAMLKMLSERSITPKGGASDEPEPSNWFKPSSKIMINSGDLIKNLFSKNGKRDE